MHSVLRGQECSGPPVGGQAETVLLLSNAGKRTAASCKTLATIIKYKHMAEPKSFKREIVLILVGAIITLSTAFLTNFYNAKREDKRANIQKRLELNDQLSKDLAKRLYLTFILYKKNRDKDSIDNDALSSYLQSKGEWNIKRYSYQSLLKHYYNDQIRVEFVTTIYNPMIDLGLKAESNITDTSFTKEYITQQDRNVAFISKLYDMTDE
jgi:hypothetical protein